MAIDSARLGACAYQHIHTLTTQIGPRPAGSPAEAEARGFVEARLVENGYCVERLPARFAPLPRFLPVYSLFACSLIVAGWTVGIYPWLGVALPLLFVGLPQLNRWLIRRRPCTGQTENLLAYREPFSPEIPTLILSAHLDSARSQAFNSRIWRRLASRTLDIVQRAAIAVAAISLLQILGLTTTPPGLQLAAGLIAGLAGGWLLVCEVLNQVFHRGRYTPGANDNASGVGVLLALAGYLSDRSFRSIRLGFLFTGAEETGLHGAQSFAAARQSTAEMSILCLDMVGSGGQMRYVSQEGLLFPLRTDRRLNDWVRAACPSAAKIDYIHKSGDFAAFLAAGIPSTSLQTSGCSEAELAYHTMDDSLVGIEPPALEMVVEALIRLVETADTERSADTIHFC